jgi:alkanesulfonate monooxygenase SsuD/methylene tetrahydromethanopterin reductase-like flavin-dependent oxidoreductase (luciferase family)
MSGGRVEIGFGRGSVGYEIAYYGQNAEERQQIYAERLEAVLQAFKTKTFSFKGKYDTFENVPMDMEPLQKPHPPLWYGAHLPDSAARAARRGLNIVCNDMLPAVRGIMGKFREVWREAHGAATALPKMGLVRFIVVADSDGKALDIARRAYLKWRHNFNYLHEMHGTLPNSPLNVESFDRLMEQGQGIAGSPTTVTRFLAEQIGGCGANYVVGQMAFGDLTLDEMLRSIQLFSSEVMPKLRDTAQVVAE